MPQWLAPPSWMPLWTQWQQSPPAGQRTLPHLKNYLEISQGTWLWAQSADMASKFPRCQSDQASLVCSRPNPTHVCPTVDRCFPSPGHWQCLHRLDWCPTEAQSDWDLGILEARSPPQSSLSHPLGHSRCQLRVPLPCWVHLVSIGVRLVVPGKGDIHMNARTHSSPTEHCIVTGWSMLITSSVKVFNIVADWFAVFSLLFIWNRRGRNNT